MQKINDIYSNNVYTVNNKQKNQTKPTFSSNNTTNEITSIPEVTNDIAVKVPMKYSKLGEMELPYGFKAHCYKLANGQNIIIIPKEGPTVLKSYVNTGSLNEPDNIRGISHYIEHNLFNGSKGLDAGEFFKATDKIGAYTNASTGMAETNYFIKSNLLNETDLEEEIKLHASMIETPKFALDMLEKEKGIVNSEINMITSDPSNLASNTTLKNLFNIQTTSEDIIGGTTNNITNLTREDVVDYFNRNYYPANIVTVVSGEVNPDETMKLMSKYFKSTKTPPATRYYEKLTPTDKPIRSDIISDKATSAFVSMGFEGPKNNDFRSAIKMETLFYLLFDTSESKKIHKELNAQTYGFQEAILSRPDASSVNSIMAEVSEGNSEKLLNSLYAQIQNLQNKPISEEQLKIVKRELKKGFMKEFESSFAVNHYVGSAVIEGRFKDISNLENLIDGITIQDIQDAAKKYLDLNRVAITIVHPQSATKDAINDNYLKAKSLSFTGSYPKAIDMNKVKQYGLNNNYRVTLYESRFPNIDAVIKHKVENPVYSENPSTYYVLNEILNNGTMQKTRDEFNKQKELDGVNVYVYANEYGLRSGFSADSADYDKAQSAFKELFEHPRFTQEEFDKAVETLRDSLSRIEKSPFNKLAPELNPQTDHTNEDILKGLDTITLEEVKRVYEQLYNNSHAIASIAAPTGKNTELKNSILKSFSEMTTVQPYKITTLNTYEPISQTKVLTDTDYKNQASILMAYKYVDSGNIHDRVSIDLMNKVFGDGPSSRLFSDLRESQKLAYAVRSNVSRNQNTGSIILSIKTTTDNKTTGEQSFDNIQKSIDGFKNNIEKIKTEKISEEELEKAKLSLKNELLSDIEWTEAKNSAISNGASNWYGPAYKNQYLEMIDKITIDDIYNAANHIFAGKPLYSIVATKETLDANEEYLNSLIN